METHAREAADSTATSCPSWAMLNVYGCSRDDSSVVTDDDAGTMAASFTSTGRSFRVSLGLAPPPATSRLFFEHDWAGGGAPGYEEHIEDPTVIASHGDAVLFEAWPPKRKSTSRGVVNTVFDNFLYEARPRSLRLLPSRPFPMQFERRGSSHPACRTLDKKNTGLLTRRRGGFVVVQLEVKFKPDDAPWEEARDTAELCVLRSGGEEWELKRAVPIVHGEATTADEARDLMEWWKTDVAVPVGDRLLCFVDYSRGFLLCDAAALDGDDSSLALWYVPLPVEVPDGCPYNYDGDQPRMRPCRNMCVLG